MNNGKERIKASMSSTRVLTCLECGKCTAVCPAHRANPTFSPRCLVKEISMSHEKGLIKDGSIWSCLTCRLCKELCLTDVDIPEFVRVVRSSALEANNLPIETHDAIVQVMVELMEEKGLDQNRLWWLEDDMNVQIDGKGEVLLFTGCSPYYDIMFREFDPTVEIPRASVKVMNAIGIVPVLLSNERCCGHDEHWTGKTRAFEELRRLNEKAIGSTGARIIVTPCPECAYTLKELYDLKAEVMHMSQFLSKRAKEHMKGKLDIGSWAFHDPCRLGRYLGEYDAPRKILSTISGPELKELEFEKEIAHCCGVGSWINCTQGSRLLRYDRLKEAEDAKVDLLVTACPKCRIHLNCYLANDKVDPVDIKVQDLTVLLAKAMGVWK